jgi:predicted dehydrogenase
VEKSKLKIGIIGSGGIAQTCHIPGYRSMPDKCEVVAVCDIYEPNAKQAAEKFSIPKMYTQFQDMLADNDIDAVSITTPNAFHLGPAVAALNAGKHVLCEKPLAMNADEAKQICRAAKEAGKVLQVALQYRFSGPMQFLKQYIDSGKMGHIYYARAQALRQRSVPGWGVFIEKDKQGGGPLIDIGVHILDMTLFCMGYPKPISASGKTWNQLGTNPDLYNSWGEYDRSKFTVEDFAVGMIKFEDGSAVVLESSFMANLEGNPFQTQLFGTKSGALVKGGSDMSLTLYTEVDRQLFNMQPANVPKVESPHTVEIEAFVNAILEGTPSPVPGEQGLILNAIFDAIYKSSETGAEQPVDVGL